MVSLVKRRGKLSEQQQYNEEDLPRLAYPYIQEAMRADSSRGTSFSKLLCIVIMSITILVVIFTIILMVMTNDLSPLEYLIPSVFVEASVISGFYSYKAKTENKIKLETRRLILEKVLNGEIQEDYDDVEEDNGLDS